MWKIRYYGIKEMEEY
jgi:hypothetical protein